LAQVVVVTGAGSGIGQATARAFIEAGATVALVGRREGPLLETAGGAANAKAYPCDVTDPAGVAAAFGGIAAAHGRIDVLFNNAGSNVKAAPVDEIPVEDWLSVINVNLTGMFLCARAAFGQMRRQVPQGGRIINNGSISSDVPRPGSAPYTASKHGVTGLTRTLSLDGRPFDIACGQIDIGNALTPMAARMTKGVTQADGSLRAEPVMDVAEVARAVVHMASLPLSANVQFMTVMATKMPYIGRG
jgi:NAD(P)-dependent dehydrogenase (short-subunit alcohol dehydrogenase family)